MKAPKHKRASSVDLATRRRMVGMIQTQHLSETLDDSKSDSNTVSCVLSTFSIDWEMDIFPFSRLIILLTLSLLKDSFMNVSMIFFIVRAAKTCNFKQYVGRSVAAIAISQLICFPLLAWITDFSSKHIAFIFTMSVFLELLIQTLMIFESRWSLNEIIFLHVLCKLAMTINTNAMYKLLKIKLLFWLRSQYSASMEHKYFQTICMSVITLQSVINAMLWFIFWYLAVNDIIPGHIIQNLIFCSTLLFTLMTQLFALAVTYKYLKQIKPINVRITESVIRFNNMHTTQRHKIATVREIEDKLDADRMEMDLEYIQCGIQNIYANKLCFESIVSSLYLMLFVSICEFVFPLFFATQNSHILDTALESMNNLCGGSIRVLIQYEVFGHIFYFVGSIFFLYFTKLFEPKMYFKQFIPIFCYLSIIMLLPLYFYTLFNLFNQFIVIFFAVIPQFLVKYNLFYSTACINQKFIGILLCIHTNLSTLTPLLSALLLTLNVDIRIVLTVAVCLLLFISIHSKAFSAKHLS